MNKYFEAKSPFRYGSFYFITKIKGLFSGKVKAHLYILIASILVAGSFLASGNVSGVISPFSLNLFRFTLASFVLLPVILYVKEYRRKVLSTLPRALVISFFYSMYFVCLFEALSLTTVLNTGALFTVVPFFTALISYVLLKVKIGMSKTLIYLIGAMGTLWVIFQGKLNLLIAFSLNQGDVIFLIGALSMCFYAVLMKKLYKNDDMIVLVFSILLGGMFWSFLILLLKDEPLQWNLIQGGVAFNMLYLSLAATLLTTYLSQKATVVLGPNKVISYFYLNPAFVAILLFFFYDETIDWILVPGIMLSIVATVLLQINKDRHY